MNGLARARAAAPVRQVHLGLGNFFRAHQAWYTEHADQDWGIAAFTGRGPAAARALAAQDGRYTLVTRDADGDRFETISSVVAAHAAAEHDRFLRYLADPAVAVITLTVTEAGYRRDADGELDLDDAEVARDLEALRSDRTAAVHSVPARLVAGLAARRAAGAGPIAIVPCDNLPGNGVVTRRLVTRFAELLDPELANWTADSVDFVDTMVDRITPRTTPEDVASVASALGVDDAAPVVTEPFSEWVLAGRFRAGRPAWDSAGANFVDEVTPFEQRKLWLLNGAHSLLAYAGLLRGHEFVADAIADDALRGWVEQWWDEAAPYLDLPGDAIVAYRSALLRRWENPRIRHALAQIAMDGSQKVPVRVRSVIDGERRAGRTPRAALRIVAAWLAYARRQTAAGRPLDDPIANRLAGMITGPLSSSVRSVLELVGGAATDDDCVVAVVDLAGELGTSPA